MIKKLYPVLIMLLAGRLFGQTPVNDDCAGLIDLGEVPYCSDPAQYTNVNATMSDIDPVSNIPACFNNAAERDVWFQFTLPADGSIVDISIAVYGDVDGNGTLHNPQVAIYRGDCIYGGLAELDCAAAPFGVNEVHLDQFGLTPGIPYFLRINDYSGTASPNWGTFKLCIEQYVPDINIGDVISTGSCTGTLWDSGGPLADYGDNEDLSLTICPQDFHQCIILHVEVYNTESGSDYLHFYQGADVFAPQITQIAGNGANFEVQVPGACATVQFTSDFSVVDEGFQITWECSPNACTTPPITTCTDPVPLGTLPFVQNNLSNCFSGNTIADGPCDDPFLGGNDYIFTYTSAGDECITLQATGTSQGAGLGVYDNCPSQPGALCIASAGGFFTANPSINAAFLENPGIYYIVFGSIPDCTTFNLSVDTVTCPVVLPPTSCDSPLDIAGCSNVQPEIIALNPGAGDPNFIQQGLNQGCFVAPQENYAFFFFQAGTNGKFGFAVESADPAEASDIDYNVWGPIEPNQDICDFISLTQPVRSSWAAGADLTGLADIHPVLGTPVLDDFDCGSPATPSANGDDFTRRLDVIAGKLYVVMLDDFGNAIVNGGISIDFGGTTAGVLVPPDDQVSVSGDTTVCAGATVQLEASGGVVYQWGPPSTLSCTNCPSPIAAPTATTSYQVQIATTCNTYNKLVNVKVYDVDLGPDVQVCNNAEFKLNPHPFDSVQYNWIGNNLSCYDCPTPVVSGLTTGNYNYFVTMVTPYCTLYDTLLIEVVNGDAPQYIIGSDQEICEGTTVQLGGPSQAGTVYDWLSDPAGFTSANPNPVVTPAMTTKYYLVASNLSCPFSSLDSLTVTVYEQPNLSLIPDTGICQGDSIVLGNSPLQPDMVYSWTPDDGTLSSTTVPNPVAKPAVTTTYVLTAGNPACSQTQSVTITVVPILIELTSVDSLKICQGTEVPIGAIVSPANLQVQWSPLSQLLVSPTGSSAVATPVETTTYTATVQSGGCTRTASVYIAVDSLPDDLGIYPADTTVCLGNPVTLISPIYEPAEYQYFEFQWLGDGQLTPDSLFNLVVEPDTTVQYQRISQNGVCVDTAYATVHVIIPPEITAVPANATICPGENVQLNVLNANGVEEITWEPANGLSCDDCLDPVAAPAVSTSYTVSGTVQGCPTAAMAFVEVKPAPVLLFPSDLDLCAGESVTLNQNNEPGTNYSWTSNPPGFISAEPGPVVIPVQTTTYYVTADNGCAVSGEVTIAVASATLTVSNDTTICKDNTVTLTAQGTLPGIYNWTTGETTQAINVKPEETTVYKVTYGFGDNCLLTDSILVAVQGEGVPFEFPDDKAICPGESIVLNNLTTPGTTYAWTSNPAGFTSNAPDPTVAPLQTTTYTVVATRGICTYTQTITISTSNPQLIVSQDTTICAGETVVLSAHPDQGTGISTIWTPGGSGDQISVTPDETTLYQVTYTFGDDCTVSESVQVNVEESFGLNILNYPDTTRIEVGTPLELVAEITGPPVLNGFSYNWLENGVTPAGNTATITPTASTNDSLLYYVLTVTSPNGCTREASIGFTVVQPSVMTPTAFTPDGDGTNDTFKLLIRQGTVTVDNMQIFNRWGEIVYESSEPDAAWDGQVDGKPAPADVYLYVIYWRRADGALQPALKGDVTVIR